MYEQGLGVKQDSKEARKRYEKLAASGYRSARRKVADIHSGAVGARIALIQ